MQLSEAGMASADVSASGMAAPQLRAVDDSTGLPAIAYPVAWRLVAALFTSISAASLPFLLAVVLFTRSQPILPSMLMRAFAILAVAPAAAAWLVKRAFAVTLHLEDAALVLGRDKLVVEIPCSAIRRIDAWTVPLPGSGVDLRLASGRRFRQGLQLDDPAALIGALARGGRSEVVAAAQRHPTTIYAHAKRQVGRWRWYHLFVKFVVFALLPTLPLFRVKQLITYGGLLGQYYQLGLQPYLQSFATYWAMMIIYLVLYAAIWRGLAEAMALVTAWVAPSQAARVRRAAETGCWVLYYIGVPALLIRFFLPM